MAGRNISESTIVEIIEMGNTGQMSAGAIAAEVNVSTQTVISVLREYGVPIGPAGRTKLTDRMEPQALEDLLERYTGSEEPIRVLLEDFGLTHGQLYNILAQTGTPRRRYTREKIQGRKDQFMHAVEMYAEGHPLWKIKEETGVHQPQLHAELHRRGVPLRRSKQIVRKESE